jgi:hypothetical protein
MGQIWAGERQSDLGDGLGNQETLDLEGSGGGGGGGEGIRVSAVGGGESRGQMAEARRAAGSRRCERALFFMLVRMVVAFH